MYEYIKLLERLGRWDIIKNLHLMYGDFSMHSDSEGIYMYSYANPENGYEKTRVRLRPTGDISESKLYDSAVFGLGYAPYMGFGYVFYPSYHSLDPVIKIYARSKNDTYKNMFGKLYPSLDHIPEGRYEKVSNHIIGDGEYFFFCRTEPDVPIGALTDKEGVPLAWTQVITDPEIQEAVALAAHDSDDHKVGYGSWRDGEVIVKKTHKIWRVKNSKQKYAVVTKDQQGKSMLYWKLLALYEAKLIYKSTLNKCLTQDSMCFTDKRTGIHINAEIRGGCDAYIVHIIPDDTPEERYVFHEI